jgi:CRP-like cAMP-binding protein
MWFCEMRQMPRLRDCLHEFASDRLRRLRDRIRSRSIRRATRRLVHW